MIKLKGLTSRHFASSLNLPLEVFALLNTPPPKPSRRHPPVAYKTSITGAPPRILLLFSLTFSGWGKIEFGELLGYSTRQFRPGGKSGTRTDHKLWRKLSKGKIADSAIQHAKHLVKGEPDTKNMIEGLVDYHNP